MRTGWTPRVYVAPGGSARPESFSQQQLLGQGWVASDPRLPGPCVHGTPSRGGGLRDVPLCPLHLRVLHEKLDPPHHQSSSHFLAQELSLSPWAGYQHPWAQDGQLVCDCLPLSYSGCGVPSPQNPRNSSTAPAVGPRDALLPLPSGWSTVSESYNWSPLSSPQKAG